METYEDVYEELLSGPVPREGRPLPHGPVLKIVMFTPPADEEDPYERLVRELHVIPSRWLL